MRKEREDGKFPLRKTRTSRFEETIRSFDVRRSEAEGPLSGGQGNLVSLILLSGPREAIHESGMRENRTFRLSGGRRRALQWAPPPTRRASSGVGLWAPRLGLRFWAAVSSGLMALSLRTTRAVIALRPAGPAS